MDWRPGLDGRHPLVDDSAQVRSVDEAGETIVHPLTDFLDGP
jgi:hypothetical protein